MLSSSLFPKFVSMFSYSSPSSVLLLKSSSWNNSWEHLKMLSSKFSHSSIFSLWLYAFPFPWSSKKYYLDIVHSFILYLHTTSICLQHLLLFSLTSSSLIPIFCDFFILFKFFLQVIFIFNVSLKWPLAIDFKLFLLFVIVFKVVVQVFVFSFLTLSSYF